MNVTAIPGREGGSCQGGDEGRGFDTKAEAHGDAEEERGKRAATLWHRQAVWSIREIGITSTPAIMTCL